MGAGEGRSPATWPVADGVATVDKKAGGIKTKRSFTNYQLHIEWRIPERDHRLGPGARQQRRLPRLDRPGDMGYELQVLDSYNNKTYVNGQAASIYKQTPPLVNAMRPPDSGRCTT